MDNFEFFSYSALDHIKPIIHLNKRVGKIIIAGNTDRFFGNLDWKVVYMPWYQMEGRDDKWMLQQIEYFGLNQFQSEYELK
jgi:hypothetical protein